MPKQKHTSVERNRLKRRLRELARTRLLPVLPPVDLVVRTLPEAYGASFAALERQLDTVLARLRTMHLPVRDVVESTVSSAGRKGERGKREQP